MRWIIKNLKNTIKLTKLTEVQVADGCFAILPSLVLSFQMTSGMHSFLLLLPGNLVQPVEQKTRQTNNYDTNVRVLMYCQCYKLLISWCKAYIAMLYVVVGSEFLHLFISNFPKKKSTTRFTTKISITTIWRTKDQWTRFQNLI